MSGTYASDGSLRVTITSGSTGIVAGPTSATDNAIVRFDGTTGKLVQNSTVSIDDSGNLTSPGYVLATTQLLAPISTVTDFRVNNMGVKMSAGTVFGWTLDTNSNSALDLTLSRDAANTLAQRNGVNAQEFRVYGTYTDASNYERGSLQYQSGGSFIIAAQKAGTGTYRAITLQTSGVNVWQFLATGHLIAVTDNTYDIGASGATRPRNLYLAGGLFGTSTNDSAAAGAVGEYISSTIASGSAVSLTTATSANLTSISLTAGDWEVEGTFHFNTATTTSYSRLIGSLSTTTATLDTTADRYSERAVPATVPGNFTNSQSTSIARFSLSGTTTIYAVANATFTLSTMTVWGILRARRVR